MMYDGGRQKWPRFRKIHIIINPSTGNREPILNIINSIFRSYGITDWQVSITHKPGDGTRLAQQAVANGVDLVAAYGGDGTLMEVVNGLLGTDVPLAILPGGTGNAMAFELQIPRQLEQAIELICTSNQLRTIDLGHVGNRYFMLRCYTGLNLSYQASREMKNQYGILAYALATFQTITDPQRSRYRLTVDGKMFEREGVSCLITNAGSVGGIDLSITPTISPDDGLLDLFVLDTDMISLLTIAGSILTASDFPETIQWWQGRSIIIEADPPQNVSTDGEAWGTTPLKAEVVPHAINVVVE